MKLDSIAFLSQFPLHNVFMLGHSPLLPTPLPTPLASLFHFPTDLCLRHFGTCARKIVENWVYHNFKGLFFVSKQLEPVILLHMGQKLTFFHFSACRNKELECGDVFVTSLDEGKQACFAVWLDKHLSKPCMCIHKSPYTQLLRGTWTGKHVAQYLYGFICLTNRMWFSVVCNRALFPCLYSLI